MSEPRDLRDLLPDDVGADELARLQRVHDLLLAAGPPEELPPSLAGPPPRAVALAAQGGGARVVAFVRERKRTVAFAAAAAAAVLFGVGFLSGYASKDSGFKAAFGPVPMVGAGATAQAVAQIWIGERDAAQNWPSRMQVRGLPALGKDGYYELWLTDAKTGRKLILCSAFAVHEGVTTVTFSYPGSGKGKGWVIVEDTPSGEGKPMLWTTPAPASGTA